MSVSEINADLDAIAGAVGEVDGKLGQISDLIISLRNQVPGATVEEVEAIRGRLANLRLAVEALVARAASLLS